MRTPTDHHDCRLANVNQPAPAHPVEEREVVGLGLQRSNTGKTCRKLQHDRADHVEACGALWCSRQRIRMEGRRRGGEIRASSVLAILGRESKGSPLLCETPGLVGAFAASLLRGAPKLLSESSYCRPSRGEGQKGSKHPTPPPHNHLANNPRLSSAKARPQMYNNEACLCKPTPCLPPLSPPSPSVRFHAEEMHLPGPYFFPPQPNQPSWSSTHPIWRAASCANPPWSRRP